MVMKPSTPQSCFSVIFLYSSVPTPQVYFDTIISLQKSFNLTGFSSPNDNPRLAVSVQVVPMRCPVRSLGPLNKFPIIFQKEMA